MSTVHRDGCPAQHVAAGGAGAPCTCQPLAAPSSNVSRVPVSSRPPCVTCGAPILLQGWPPHVRNCLNCYVVMGVALPPMDPLVFWNIQMAMLATVPAAVVQMPMVDDPAALERQRQFRVAEAARIALQRQRDKEQREARLKRDRERKRKSRGPDLESACDALPERRVPRRRAVGPAISGFQSLNAGLFATIADALAVQPAAPVAVAASIVQMSPDLCQCLMRCYEFAVHKSVPLSSAAFQAIIKPTLDSITDVALLIRYGLQIARNAPDPDAAMIAAKEAYYREARFLRQNFCGDLELYLLSHHQQGRLTFCVLNSCADYMEATSVTRYRSNHTEEEHKEDIEVWMYHNNLHGDLTSAANHFDSVLFQLSNGSFVRQLPLCKADEPARAQLVIPKARESSRQAAATHAAQQQQQHASAVLRAALADVADAPDVHMQPI